MTIQDEKLKKLAMAIKAAKRRKDPEAVDRLVSEREVYKKSQENVDVSVKRPKLNDSCVQSKVSVGNSPKESVRQSVKVNVSDIVTESVEITTRLENPIYKKTSHFANMLENTKDIETHKYTEEQYNADFKKLFEDVKQNEKYTKGQTNYTKKYAHIFKKLSDL
jgi:hypothetical protein